MMVEADKQIINLVERFKNLINNQFSSENFGWESVT